jgi:hypothetical protein
VVGSNPTGCKDDIEKRSDTIQLKKSNKEGIQGFSSLLLFFIDCASFVLLRKTTAINIAVVLLFYGVKQKNSNKRI